MHTLYSSFIKCKSQLVAIELRYPEMSHVGASDIYNVNNREEKPLRQVVLVAKFLDDNKPKRYLKSGFAQFQTSSILFNFA